MSDLLERLEQRQHQHGPIAPTATAPPKPIAPKHLNTSVTAEQHTEFHNLRKRFACKSNERALEIMMRITRARLEGRLVRTPLDKPKPVPNGVKEICWVRADQSGTWNPFEWFPEGGDTKNGKA